MIVFFILKIVLSFINVEPTSKTCSYVSVEDLDLLSKLIYVEADQQDVKDMFLVGSTVMNRVFAYNYPDNLHDVINQKRQYIGTLSKAWGTRTLVTDKVAYMLLKGHYVRGIKYFYNPKTSTDTLFVKNMQNYPILYKTTYHIFQ